MIVGAHPGHPALVQASHKDLMDMFCSAGGTEQQCLSWGLCRKVCEHLCPLWAASYSNRALSLLLGAGQRRQLLGSLLARCCLLWE